MNWLEEDIKSARSGVVKEYENPEAANGGWRQEEQDNAWLQLEKIIGWW